MKGSLVISAVLALLAAGAYFLLATGVIPVPPLENAASNEGGPSAAVAFYLGGSAYALGALLLLLVRRRWLRILGMIGNALVIIIFVSMYSRQPQVMFSTAGLTTKIPQILLEVVLVYLVARRTGAAAVPARS